MVNAGKRHVRLLPDGWTVITKDHSLSAQWEHTVLVTDTGVEVLTLGAADANAARARQNGSVGGSRSERLPRCPSAPLAPAHPPAGTPGRARKLAGACREYLRRGSRATAPASSPKIRRGAGARARRTRSTSSLQEAWRKHCGRLRSGHWSRSAATDAANCTRLPISTSCCSCRQPPRCGPRRRRAPGHLPVGHRARGRATACAPWTQCAEESTADVSVMTTLLEARLSPATRALRANARPRSPRTASGR